MVLKLIGGIIVAVAAILILVKLSTFFIIGDYSDDTTAKFTDDILNIGINASIPIEITIIIALGGVGAIIVILDRISGG